MDIAFHVICFIKCYLHFLYCVLCSYIIQYIVMMVRHNIFYQKEEILLSFLRPIIGVTLVILFLAIWLCWIGVMNFFDKFKQDSLSFNRKYQEEIIDELQEYDTELYRKLDQPSIFLVCISVHFYWLFFVSGQQF